MTDCDNNYGDVCVESECRNDETCVIAPSVNITCMQLLKSYKNSCRRNKAYGFSGDSIWVNKGCEAKFNVCYTDGITTEQTTPELTTILTTTLSNPDPDTVSNSTTGAREDVGEVDGAVIGGAVCGAVVALVLIILIIIIVHHRTKSRHKRHNISQKNPPPVYDYAYGNCPEGNAHPANLETEDKNTESEQTKLSQIVIDCSDTKPTVADLNEPSQTTENTECEQPALDSYGYLLLEEPGDKKPHHSIEGDTYDYAYSDNHKRHSADDYVNTRVSSNVDVTKDTGNSTHGDYVNSRVISTVDSNNAEYSLSKDTEVPHTEQLYEIPEPIVREDPSDIDNKQSGVPMAGYSLAKTVSGTDKNVHLNTNDPKEYSLSKVTDKESNSVPKLPDKNVTKETATKKGKPELASNTNDMLNDSHVYQNTQVKQMIAKLNESKSELITGVKQKDDSKQGKNNRNDITKRVNINKTLLQLGVPQIRNSNSETQLDKKSESKPKKALMPPTHRIKKSASADALK